MQPAVKCWGPPLEASGVWENPLWKKDMGMLSASWDKRLEKKGASH